MPRYESALGAVQHGCASIVLAGKRGLAAEARALVHSRRGLLTVAGASCLQALLRSYAGCGKYNFCFTGGFRVLG